MEIGLGIDIIEIERIKASIEKYGEHFLKKVFTENEIAYCLSKGNRYQHFAARFAAKEAVSKALSTGWNKDFKWTNVEVINEASGMPKAILKGRLKEFLEPDKELKISISHSRDNVACVAILYQK